MYIYNIRIVRFKLNFFIAVPANQFILEVLVDLQNGLRQDRNILNAYKVLYILERRPLCFMLEKLRLILI